MPQINEKKKKTQRAQSEPIYNKKSKNKRKKSFILSAMSLMDKSR